MTRAACCTSGLELCWGTRLGDYAHSPDRAKVELKVEHKSVSAEIDWGICFKSQAGAEAFVQNLHNELHRREALSIMKFLPGDLRVPRTFRERRVCQLLRENET